MPQNYSTVRNKHIFMPSFAFLRQVNPQKARLGAELFSSAGK
jgi:hypothetical protein